MIISNPYRKILTVPLDTLYIAEALISNPYRKILTELRAANSELRE